jgi:hypothetical protein
MPRAAFVKRCPACDTWQPVENYHRDRRASDGLYGYCKDCQRAKRRAAYNPEQEHAYYVEHAARRRQYMREYYQRRKATRNG